MNANIHRALGCIGAIIDGAVRDVDEMRHAGFKTLARRLCVGHACAIPIRWGCEVEVFGRKILPGQLIHADKHGFIAIPPGEKRDLLEASRFMDQAECDTLIPAQSGAAADCAWLRRDPAELVAPAARPLSADGLEIRQAAPGCFHLREAAALLFDQVVLDTAHRLGQFEQFLPRSDAFAQQHSIFLLRVR